MNLNQKIKAAIRSKIKTLCYSVSLCLPVGRQVSVVYHFLNHRGTEAQMVTEMIWKFENEILCASVLSVRKIKTNFCEPLCYL